MSDKDPYTDYVTPWHDQIEVPQTDIKDGVPDPNFESVLADYVSPDTTTLINGLDNADAFTQYSKGTLVVTDAFEVIPISAVAKPGQGVFMGIAIYAATGTAQNAVVLVHDGLDATGPLLAVTTAEPGKVSNLTLGPILYKRGLYLEVVSPFTRAVLYTRAEIQI